MKYTLKKDMATGSVILSRINKHGRQITFAFRVENIDNVHVDDEEIKSIRWCVDDFAHQAVELEEYEQEEKGLEERPTLYDRTKFPDALQQMIRKHDANDGISWSTIECYLDMMCLIKEQEPCQNKQKQ